MSMLAENKILKSSVATTSAPGRNPFFQAKLAVNEPGDVYEQEADAMADKVIGMKASSSQSFFNSAISTVQRKEGTDTGTNDRSVPDNYINSLGSSGRPLSEASRRFFEPRFGYDFSDVRVHTDESAAKSAQSINALAYTTGNHIVFSQGQFAPNSEAGQKLMAHELTHVVQQRSNVAAPKLQRHVNDIVAYSGGQSGFIWVIEAGKLIYSANAVSGHVGRGENEPNAGPIPTGKYMLHPNIVAPTVSKLEGGVCGADGISAGFQEITSHDPSPCSLSHYCNVPCPTKDNPAQKCFTPIDCWGPKRIRIEGSADVVNPAGKHVTRGGFFIHGGNPADAVSSGCVKSLDNGVFDNIRKLKGVRGAVPFCVGSACPATVNNAIVGALSDIGNALLNDLNL
ncbi:MAG: eCIS core domain-containing protein [Mucilaginibacter sp.]